MAIVISINWISSANNQYLTQLVQKFDSLLFGPPSVFRAVREYLLIKARNLLIIFAVSCVICRRGVRLLLQYVVRFIIKHCFEVQRFTVHFC